MHCLGLDQKSVNMIAPQSQQLRYGSLEAVGVIVIVVVVVVFLLLLATFHKKGRYGVARNVFKIAFTASSGSDPPPCMRAPFPPKSHLFPLEFTYIFFFTVESDCSKHPRPLL